MEVTELHREAMSLADRALVARLSGDTVGASALLREAYRHEREAAERVSSQQELEPTRSVLHRSAASLALECNELREAEKLVALALAGDPPTEIADELRDLLEQVH